MVLLLMLPQLLPLMPLPLVLPQLLPLSRPLPLRLPMGLPLKSSGIAGLRGQRLGGPPSLPLPRPHSSLLPCTYTER